MTPADKAAAIVRIAHAFDVAGAVGADSTVLVLRAAEPMPSAEVLEGFVQSLGGIFPGSVVVVPPGWTQEQIDAEAVRVAVEAEREACAALVDRWAVDSEPFGSRDFPGRVFEAVDALAKRIRERSLSFNVELRTRVVQHQPGDVATAPCSGCGADFGTLHANGCVETVPYLERGKGGAS